MQKKIFKNNYFLLLLMFFSIFFFNFLSYNYFIKDFISLEDKENKKNIINLINTIDSSLDNLKVITKDYSNWDDTYNFINDLNNEYIYENFREGSVTLENIYIDFMIFVNNDNKVVYSIYTKDISFKTENHKNNFETEIKNQVLKKTDTSLINYENKNYYLTKANILKSDLTGEPRGYIYAGRLFNLENLNKRFFNTLSISNKTSINKNIAFESKFINKINVQYLYENENLINLLSFYGDNKNEILRLELLNTRDLYKEGKENILFFNIIISISFIFLFFIFYLYLDNQVKINKKLEIKIKEEIEKRREQENLLIQQSKLASMGDMINNIAHQWRQPLNALSLVTQNINLSYQENDLTDSFMKSSMEKSNNLIKSMSKTIDDFRDFFKPSKSKILFDINKTLQNTTNLTKSTLSHHNIELIENYQGNLLVYNYENEFSQVILNIINNAKDALLNDNIKSPKIFINTLINNNLAIIKIKDNANGIDEKIINKIFEPYFTTKEKTNGTGIGLYMSKTIIEKNMNGKIKVITSKEGSEFILSLELD